MLGVQGWSQVHVALALLVSVRHRTQGVTDAGAGAVSGDGCLIHGGPDTCPRGVAVPQRGVAISDVGGEEEEEEEEGLFKADAVNEEDPERDRATPA